LPSQQRLAHNLVVLDDFLYSEPVAQAVPEPVTWIMMLLGFAGLGFTVRRSRRKVPAQVGTLVSAA
jgi:hypothetical protein